MTLRRILVVGGGDVGSAVAHCLFRLGLDVLVSEKSGSTHARRGMAFTDALFDGEAVLDGVAACHQSDIAAVQECWRRHEAVPIVTLPEAELSAALAFDVVVEATMRRNQPQPDLRPLAPMTVGLGPGYVPQQNCHIAVETQWGSSMGEVLRERPAAVRSGGPYALGGVGRERFAIAPEAGIWRTTSRLGQAVASGDELGRVGTHAIRAPLQGHLRGVTHDGVEVRAGQRIAEVDPRDEPQIFGLGERPQAIAAGVVKALGLDAAPARAL